ncbi:MAG: tetratricopeptide repeat protein [candidate division WOR-3 bacterium]|nr:tetratricopeptide repeat protein [candidate division WOR-3 bacterium]
MKKKTYFQKGKELFDNGKYRKALINFLNAMKEHPDWPDIRNMLGLTYNMLGDLDEAEIQFQKAIELNENYVEAHLNLALTYNENAKLDLASTEFNIASKLEKEFGKSGFGIKQKLINLHVTLGNTYFEIGKYPDAMDEYKKADRISSNFPDIKLLLGKTYLKQKKYSGAIIELNRALRLNPNLDEATLVKGLAYYKKGDHKRARKCWEKLLDHKNWGRKAKHYMAMLKDSNKE